MLLKSLEDSDRAVRLKAALALKSQGWTPETPEYYAKYLVAKQEWDQLVPFGTIAIEPLIKCFEEKATYHDRNIRSKIIEVLGKIREQAPEALDKLLEHPEPSNRLKAIGELAKLGDSHALNLLINALSSEDKSVRHHAAKEAERIENPHLVEPLIKALGDDYQPAQFHAREALVKLGSQAIELLLKALDHENSRIRQEIALIFTELQDSRAIEPLTRALEDTDGHVRFYAARALQKLGKAHGIEALINIALSDENEYIRSSAVMDLAKIDDARCTETVFRALEDKNKEVRRTAVTEIGGIGNSRAIKSLILALKDQDAEVREEAIKELAELGDSSAIKPLIEVLEDPDYNNRFYAAEALDRLEWNPETPRHHAQLNLAREDWENIIRLAKMGNDSVVEILISALEDDNDEIRFKAASALGEINDASAKEPLILRLEDKTPFVRAGAAIALGKLGDPRAIEPLIKTLEKRSVNYPMILKDVIKILEKLGGKQALTPIINVLKNYPNFFLIARIQAARTLVNFKDLRAIEQLIITLGDENESIRREAAKALEEIGSQAIEPLTRATQHTNPNIQQWAKKILKKLEDE
ncbi:MAG: HEAT repeat domain-containing protein [Promethearchaeota archaeon]